MMVWGLVMHQNVWRPGSHGLSERVYMECPRILLTALTALIERRCVYTVSAFIFGSYIFR